MGMPIELDPEARADFDTAFSWYAERSADAAIGFASEVAAAYQKIAVDSERFPKTFAECRHCSLQRYPYGVIFYQDAGTIFIVAIAHAKRRPKYWRHRLS